MDHPNFINRASLLLFVLFATTLRLFAQEAVEVGNASSPAHFGRIEIRVADEDEWKPLRRGMKLTGDDWIRMPPASLLELKVLSNGKSTLFAGSQMQTVAQLLGLSTEEKPGQIILPDGTTVNIGRMPKATDASRRTEPTRQTEYYSISDDELAQLLALVPQQDEDLQASLAPITAKAPYREIPHIGRAIWILDELLVKWLIREPATAPGFSDRRQSPSQKVFGRPEDAIDYGLLYYTLLKLARIPVETRSLPPSLELSEKGFYLLIKSGLSETAQKRITANWQLVVIEADQVWIPLYVAPGLNFASAWYKGAVIAQKLKRHP